MGVLAERVFEGGAVIITAAAVWVFDSWWPDVLVATALLILFLRSALRVLGRAWREMRTQGRPQHT